MKELLGQTSPTPKWKIFIRHCWERIRGIDGNEKPPESMSKVGNFTLLLFRRFWHWSSGPVRFLVYLLTADLVEDPVSAASSAYRLSGQQVD